MQDTNGIGGLNPFRYRGYYWDSELNLYYLNARYYDPLVGRFISQDDIEYLDPEALNGLNLYAYCINNPLKYVDYEGHAWWHWLIGGLVVAGLFVATCVTAGGALAGMAAISAAVMGMQAVGASVLTTTLAFAAVGAGTVYFASAIVAGVNAIETWTSGGSFIDGVKTFLDQGESTMWAAIGAGLTGAAVGYVSYVDYGIKTPRKLRPFGTFYNSKDKTITHYDIKGRMWWSKHLTDHGRPDRHSAPHWHAEMPHYPVGFDKFYQLLVELIKRLFEGH